MLEENNMKNSGVHVCMPSFILPDFFLLFMLRNKLQLLMNKLSLQISNLKFCPLFLAPPLEPLHVINDIWKGSCKEDNLLTKRSSSQNWPFINTDTPHYFGYQTIKDDSPVIS